MVSQQIISQAFEFIIFKSNHTSFDLYDFKKFYNLSSYDIKDLSSDLILDALFEQIFLSLTNKLGDSRFVFIETDLIEFSLNSIKMFYKLKPSLKDRIKRINFEELLINCEHRFYKYLLKKYPPTLVYKSVGISTKLYIQKYLNNLKNILLDFLISPINLSLKNLEKTFLILVN